MFINNVLLNCAMLFIPVKGIPYNVTVFGVNGKGSGPNVSKITYAEEDGKYFHLMVHLTFVVLQFRGLQEV